MNYVLRHWRSIIGYVNDRVCEPIMRRKKGDDLAKALSPEDFYDLVQLPLKPELTPEDIRSIRRSVARSCKEFERLFQVPARTMEAYEQGRRKPDAATRALLIIIAKEPEAAKRALSPLPPWNF